jgi:soluble lytic murein transglycosylase-like protein
MMNLLLILFAAILLLPLPGPAQAAEAIAAQRTYQWLDHFVEPCHTYKVPLALALAIARQESGTQPWVINVAGQSLYPSSRPDARRIADWARSRDFSFDVGIMQINSYWLKKYSIPVEDVLDPQKNIAMGVWILAKEIQRYGLTWQAVGAYHTPLGRNPERARKYAVNVINHMRNICETDKKLRQNLNQTQAGQ